MYTISCYDALLQEIKIFLYMLHYFMMEKGASQVVVQKELCLAFLDSCSDIV